VLLLDQKVKISRYEVRRYLDHDGFKCHARQKTAVALKTQSAVKTEMITEIIFLHMTHHIP